MKEIEHDAEELEDEMTNGIGDTTDKMRKVRLKLINIGRFYNVPIGPLATSPVL